MVMIVFFRTQISGLVDGFIPIKRRSSLVKCIVSS